MFLRCNLRWAVLMVVMAGVPLAPATADDEKPAVLDGHGFGPGPLGIDRVDGAIQEDAIGGWLLRCTGRERDKDQHCDYRAHHQPPPPPPSPVATEEEEGSNLVTFRFLGLKTDKKRILFLVDMNRFLAAHEPLVRDTVIRAMDSLQEGYEFGILGFQQQDSGAEYYRWPADGGLVAMNDRSRSDAKAFLRNISDKFEGSSSVLEAFSEAFKSEAGAIILVSDGLPNPSYNNGLASGQLVRAITVANRRQQEVHAVTVGDYFKYKGTVEFMESLARANGGGFLALSG